MKLPIALALEYPKRPNGLLPSIDLAKIHSLTFDDVDPKRYPLYYLTRSLIEKNSSYNVLINALDEILVDKFLDSKIAFGDIYKIIYSESEKFNPVKLNTPEEIVLLDREIKEKYTL